MRVRHPDQLWWPELGLRKRDVIEYYRAVAPALLPHLRRRPFTLKRHYNGPRSPYEWLKDAPPELPAWMPTADVPARSRGGAPVRYALVEDDLALAWVVDFGCVDLHVAAERVDRLDRPDHALFDLDPAGVAIGDVARAALLLRSALDALGLCCTRASTRARSRRGSCWSASAGTATCSRTRWVAGSASPPRSRASRSPR